ncbi:LytTR family DNA-binding domain-containing protein [Fulvivirgaceae bacterium BMA10]|uniref:LytTR family DNA-binding domain-containing protein n=1 Tax=Splendidivirga corallicola TaxID=3051826 RepID=A0ABT8KJI7_9BACT|nr:LytTR family DNA-binding domain-containing protein [Fulvivirgaceae bacterium BMA10]
MSLKLTYPSIKKSEVRILTYALAALSILFVVFMIQNYFRYGSGANYNIGRSLTYFSVTIFLFLPVVYLINRFSQWLIQKGSSYPWAWHVLFSFTVLLLYALIINMILYILDFSSFPVDVKFFRSYFTRIANIHFVLYWGVVLYGKYRIKKEQIGKFISAYNGKSKVICKLDTILWIESYDHYVKLHTLDEQLIKRASISKLSDSLDKNFVRIHRRYIVNTRFVQRVYKEHRDTFVMLENKTKLKISKTYRKTLNNLLQSHV